MTGIGVAVTRELKAMSRPILYIFGGLPGTGKTTLARKLAISRNAAYLRIDTVEQGLRDLCDFDVEGEGYRLSYRIANDNLQIGLSVVADSCNPIQLTRDEWQDVAARANADFVNIEVVCSDPNELRERVESRESDIDGLYLPTWRDVEKRQFDPWSGSRVVIETFGRTSEESFDELTSVLEGYTSA